MEPAWTGDVLNRQPFASLLGKSLLSQARAQALRGAGMTVALDSDWGTGKTFFVRRWAEDLRAAGHPVVFFDAWENDIGDEASIALMSAIRMELDVWSHQLPVTKRVQEKAANASRDALKGLRRALIPATKVIATEAIKKLTGVGVAGVVEAWRSGEEDVEAFDSTTEAVDAGLDELFKRVLEDHQRRTAAIGSFKASVEELTALLASDAKAELPVFVFIDEVDRCRPTYAIKLLEEIKHIFGAKSLCFVISTNIKQLRESVRAVYGAGFDGHRYLQRFFDLQYALPEPDNVSFAQQLLLDDPLIASRAVVTGLPRAPEGYTLAQSIAFVAEGFDLDLRSQKQVFRSATSVIGVIPTERPVFALWLFFLCALQHRWPQVFDSLNLGRRMKHGQFAEMCSTCLVKDVSIRYLKGDGTAAESTLSQVVYVYYNSSHEDLMSARSRAVELNSYDFPDSNVEAIAAELTQFNPRVKSMPSISRYVEWVKYVGVAS